MDAKLLYGLLLDRMSLSAKNGWYDEQGRVYIYYTLDEIQEDLNCGHDKATIIPTIFITISGSMSRAATPAPSRWTRWWRPIRPGPR